MTRPLRKWRFGRARYVFAPVPACLADTIQAVQSRYGVTLSTEFSA